MNLDVGGRALLHAAACRCERRMHAGLAHKIGSPSQKGPPRSSERASACLLDDNAACWTRPSRVLFVKPGVKALLRTHVGSTSDQILVDSFHSSLIMRGE